MKIVHFSDPHSCAPPEEFSAFFDKRIVGFANYIFRRRFQHDLNLLEKAVEVILDEKPDVAICTGDLTSTGQPAEFEKTLKKLEPLIQDKQIKLLYVPGNHDAYVQNSSCKKALSDAFAKLNDYQWELSDLPAKVTIGECEFILINECVPTNIFLSCGYVTKQSSLHIKEWCKQEKAQPRILVGHFPVKRDYTLMEARRGLKNHQQIRALIESKKIDLSLCGHVHKEYTDIDSEGRGEICGGSVTRSGNIGIIEYNKNDDTFSFQKKSFTLE
jgi:3',5'-cyclic-AMP phosphodiesterase